jgi:hypothetical protein
MHTPLSRGPDLGKLVAACRNADNGYGVTPGAPPAAGGTSFAGIILHRQDSK